jgi:hypothetical protein
VRRGLIIVALAAVLAGCAIGQTAESQKIAGDLTGGSAAPVGEFSEREPIPSDAGAAYVANEGRKIIETASIDLEVADPEASSATVHRLADQYGGYISAEQTYRERTDGPAFSTLQVRVAADQLDAFVEALKAEALDVRSLSTSSQDISEEYSDLEAQLKNLTAYEDELRLLLADVRERSDAKPEDLLNVFESIRQVRGEIEQLQGRQRLYDTQVALATVSVTLTPSEALEPIAKEGWDIGTIFRSALRGLVAALQWLVSVVIWLGVFALPILLLILVPVAIVFLIVRRILKRRRGVTAD